MKSLKNFLKLCYKDINKLEESMKGSEFIFDSIDYNPNKISLNCGGSNIDFLEWLKNKKLLINPKYDVGKCFQYAVTVTWNYIKAFKTIQKE